MTLETWVELGGTLVAALISTWLFVRQMRKDAHKGD